MTTGMSVADRLASFERIFNFRDLGGYPTTGGPTVRWGRLYRSDGLHHVTEHDLDTLRGLGLRTVIDLRTLDEVAEAGHYPVDRHPVDRHHLPLIHRTWEDDARLAVVEDDAAAPFLTERYVEMLAEGGPAFATAVRVLSRPEAFPVVFHCAVGKDRTGVVAALLLSLVGVAEDQIVHDYTLSALGMARIEDWLAVNSPEGAASWASQPAAWLASPPQAMAAFLARLRDEHGCAEGYLLDRGADPAAIAAVRANLLR